MAAQLDLQGNYHILELPRNGITLCCNMLKQYLKREDLTDREESIAREALDCFIQQTVFITSGSVEDNFDSLYIPTGVLL